MPVSSTPVPQGNAPVVSARFPTMTLPSLKAWRKSAPCLQQQQHLFLLLRLLLQPPRDPAVAGVAAAEVMPPLLLLLPTIIIPTLSPLESACLAALPASHQRPSCLVVSDAVEWWWVVVGG